MKAGKSWPLFFIRLSGFVLIMCAGTALLSVHLQSGIGFLPNKSGGALGQELGAFSLNTFNITGGTLILFTLFLLGVTLFRSEEHTSELQSRFDLVCRLLLEKKTKQ